MTEAVGRPAYQQVAADLREKIAAGDIAVGAAIPSTARLAGEYGVSITVVRAAVNQLRADGLVTGQPGKGVFVSATPSDVTERAAAIGDLAERIEELQEASKAEAAWRTEIEAEVAKLRERVRVVEAQLHALHESDRRTDQAADSGERRT